MKQQLSTLGLSLSQEEGIINANRCGRHSLSLRNWRKPEALLEAKSAEEVLEISDSMEEQLLQGDMGDEDKISSIEDKAEDEWDKNEFTQSQIEALNKLKSSELNTSTTTTTATVKSEPLSNNDIMFVGHFISSTYEGPRVVKDSIKQKYISPEMLMQYNKSAVGDQKIVPIQEVLDNMYDVRNVYTGNEFF